MKTAEDEVLDFKIEQKENVDVNVLQNAFNKNCKHKCELLRTESGTHYDAKLYIADDGGKMRLNCYMELKMREYENTTFKDILLSVDKCDWLTEIREEDKVPIKFVFIFPKSNCYYVYDLDEVKATPKEYKYVNKCTLKNRKEKVLTLCHLIPRDDNRKRNLHLGE